MGAAGKAALPEVGRKFREGMLDILFGDAAKLLGFQAGKARRIGQAAAADLEDLHLTGSVAAAAQFLADLAGLALQLGCQSVQQRGLAHAGVAAESTQVVFDLRLDLRRALAVLSEEERMIIGLSVYGGYQSQEISKILHMKDGTVRSKRSRAIGKMSMVLKKGGAGYE